MARPEVAPHPQDHAPLAVTSPRRNVAVDIGGTVPLIRTSRGQGASRQGASLRAVAPEPHTSAWIGEVESGTAAEHAVTAQDPAVTVEELAILALLASGLVLDAVAARVAMSPRTVSRRLRGLCDRLGVAHPIQAIVWAARRGLI